MTQSTPTTRKPRLPYALLAITIAIAVWGAIGFYRFCGVGFTRPDPLNGSDTSVFIDAIDGGFSVFIDTQIWPPQYRRHSGIRWEWTPTSQYSPTFYWFRYNHVSFSQTIPRPGQQSITVRDISRELAIATRPVIIFMRLARLAIMIGAPIGIVFLMREYAFSHRAPALQFLVRWGAR